LCYTDAHCDSDRDANGYSYCDRNSDSDSNAVCGINVLKHNTGGDA
jgi:hypothetical protein